MTTTVGAPPKVTVIRPSRGWSWVDVGELWRYRELLFFLVWRDVKVRYKQTLLGAAWAILKPFLSMVIFTVIFGNFAGIPTDNVPPPVFYYTGLLPWLLFQDGVSKAARSLVTGRNLLTKVYFPRLLLPGASVIAGLVDFLIASIVLAGLMAYFGVVPTSDAWTLPFFVFLTLVTAFGAGFWLSALNVTYRDIGYVTPFLLQAWMYASPVIYSATIIPSRIGQLLIGLNPMAGVVQGFRWAVIGEGQPDPLLLAASAGVSIVLFLSGLLYFRKTQASFADVI